MTTTNELLINDLREKALGYQYQADAMPTTAFTRGEQSYLEGKTAGLLEAAELLAKDLPS